MGWSRIPIGWRVYIVAVSFSLVLAELALWGASVEEPNDGWVWATVALLIPVAGLALQFLIGAGAELIGVPLTWAAVKFFPPWLRRQFVTDAVPEESPTDLPEEQPPSRTQEGR